MRLDIDGPKVRYQDRPADFTLKVVNTGEVGITNVTLPAIACRRSCRSRMPPPADASLAATSRGCGRSRPREERVLSLSTLCTKQAQMALQTATASGDGGVRAEAQRDIQILGIPALRTEIAVCPDRSKSAETHPISSR